MSVPKHHSIAVDDATNWRSIVEGILGKDQAAFEELYRQLHGLRYLLAKRLGHQDAEDRFHDIILIIVNNIRRGKIRYPECLAGYAQTLVRNTVAAGIASLVHVRTNTKPEHEVAAFLPDQRPSPEADAVRQERTDIAYRVLRAMPERDRQMLVRFYMKEQGQKEIQRELGITETQFRLIKSRAKARYTALLQRRMEPRPVVTECRHKAVRAAARHAGER